MIVRNARAATSPRGAAAIGFASGLFWRLATPCQ